MEPIAWKGTLIRSERALQTGPPVQRSARADVHDYLCSVVVVDEECLIFAHVE